MSSEVLVTGASGLLGYEVCRQLELIQRSFIGITRSVKVDFEFGKNLQLDLTHRKVLESLFKINPGIIIHCAAGIPGSSFDDGVSVIGLNLQMDRLVLDLVRKTGARLIYMSTTAVYGFPASKVLREVDGPQCELSKYAAFKRQIESEICSSKMNALILRLNAPYGPRQSTFTVLKRFIHLARENENIYYFGTGGRKQDFTHVSDVADLIVRNLDTMVTGIFNVSFGNPISMKDLAYKVIDLTPGCTSEVLPANKPDTQDSHEARYDTTDAKTKLGWRPKLDLISGIQAWINQLE